MRLLHARRGTGLAAQTDPAHRRRDRPPDQRGCPAARRHGGAVYRRRATAALRPRPEISLTTNGIGLTRLAGPLRSAGLDRINVSLDTLRPATFRELSRRDRLADVLDGVAAAVLPGSRL